MKSIREILKELDIEWVRQTDNVANVNCPFCSRDTKHHCGIFLDYGNFHCFKCGKVGSLFEILKGITGLSWHQYLKITKDDKTQSTKGIQTTVSDRIRQKFKSRGQVMHKIVNEKDFIELPNGRKITQDILPEFPLLERFLKQRKITSHTCKEYCCTVTSGIGIFAHRLVMPIWDGLGRIVTFQARDLTGKADAKYISGKGLHIGDFLYWSDIFGSLLEPPRLYIVEGIFDVWRMETNAVATFGTLMSKKQAQALTNDKRIDEVVFAWDSDAYKKALKAAKQLATFIRKVGVVKLPDGEDPDSLGPELVKSLDVVWV